MMFGLLIFVIAENRLPPWVSSHSGHRDGLAGPPGSWWHLTTDPDHPRPPVFHPLHRISVCPSIQKINRIIHSREKVTLAVRINSTEPNELIFSPQYGNTLTRQPRRALSP